MDLDDVHPLGPAANTRKRHIDHGDGDFPDKRVKVDSNFVQITGSAQEVDGKVRSFLQKKREQSDYSNQMEFIEPKAVGDEWKSARTSTKAIERNTQIKIYEVENEQGPQTEKPTPASSSSSSSTAAARATASAGAKRAGAGDKSGAASAAGGHNLDEIPGPVEERLRNMEEHLKLYPQVRAVPKDIYARLKKLEERVLLLERRGIYPPKAPNARGGSAGTAAGGDDFDDDEWMPRGAGSSHSSRPRQPRQSASSRDDAPKTAPVLPPLGSGPGAGAEEVDLESKMAEIRRSLEQKASSGSAAPSVPPLPAPVVSHDVVMQDDNHDHLEHTPGHKDDDMMLHDFGSHS